MWDDNIQMKHRKTVRENMTWIELAQNHVPWPTLVLDLLKLRVLLSEDYLIIDMDLRKISCQDDGWNWLKAMSNGKFWY
jgi:hypothetical protein